MTPDERRRQRVHRTRKRHGYIVLPVVVHEDALINKLAGALTEIEIENLDRQRLADAVSQMVAEYVDDEGG